MRAFAIWASLSVAVGIAVLLAPVPCHTPGTPPREVIIRRGVLVADENASANPCDRFYNSVCGSFQATGPHSGTLRDLGYQNRMTLELPAVRDDCSLTGCDGSGAEDFPEIVVQLSPANGTLYAWVSTANSVSYVPASSPCLPEPLASLVQSKSQFVMVGDDLASAPCEIPTGGPIADLETLCGNSATTQFLRGFDGGPIRDFVYVVRDYVVDWINALPSETETKREAIRRVRSISVQVGGGEMVPDCSMCNQTELDPYACTVERWEAVINLAGQPQKPVWAMAASEANAYFSSDEAAIFIPAGIARPPLYHPSYPFQYNLGGLGSIIAHELGHSIDLNGGAGFISADREPFAQCVADGFLEVGQNTSRSELTINENIADTVSALSIGPYLDRTGFAAFGQIWCKLHPSDPVAADPHSAAKLRVNAAAAMSPHFSQTFGCPPPDQVCAL